MNNTALNLAYGIRLLDKYNDLDIIPVIVGNNGMIYIECESSHISLADCRELERNGWIHDDVKKCWCFEADRED